MAHPTSSVPHFIRFACLLVAAWTLSSCASIQKASPPLATASISPRVTFAVGRFVAIQGPTSEDQTLLNLLVPRLKNYIYQAADETGQPVSVEVYATIHSPVLHWKVDKLHIKGLSPGKTYTLKIIDDFRGRQTLVDEREFSALPLNKDEVTFALVSCMSDDARFEADIDPMWSALVDARPELIVMSGDNVYVDSFDFVPRGTGTELDIWQRYIATFQRIPFYRARRLTPILATWDDHDFGTNNGDRTFVSREGARKVFLAFFGGRRIDNVYEPANEGVYGAFYGFGQRFFLLDNRMFRAAKTPTGGDEFATFGKKQHEWFFSSLNKDVSPAWIIEGTQFFSGSRLDFKESFQDDHPTHFRRFVSDLKASRVPVVFGSGDIHFSEIMRIDAELLGYPTYEITSSPLHSYKSKGPWDNPLRLAATPEFNFLLIKSKVQKNGLHLNIEARGLAPAPYFLQELTIERP